MSKITLFHTKVADRYFGPFRPNSKLYFWSNLTLSSEPKFQPENLENEKASISKKSRILTKENIYTIPNMLTLSRIGSTPILGYLIVAGQYQPALALLMVAGITDALDGYIARKYNSGTVLGTVLDPFADKLLITTLTISLTMANQVPLWLATLIIGRDVGLILASFVVRYKTLPEPKTFVRYWDVTIPSVEVHPTTISKLNTLLQITLMASTLLSSSLDLPQTLGWLTYLQYATAFTTVGSGLSYMVSKNAIKVLTKP